MQCTFDAMDEIVWGYMYELGRGGVMKSTRITCPRVYLPSQCYVLTRSAHKRQTIYEAYNIQHAYVPLVYASMSTTKGRELLISQMGKVTNIHTLVLMDVLHMQYSNN